MENPYLLYVACNIVIAAIFSEKFLDFKSAHEQENQCSWGAIVQTVAVLTMLFISFLLYFMWKPFLSNGLPGKNGEHTRKFHLLYRE
jgi:ABC-type dipeptide/oligopeptide/nickel transport system permease subunit